ncbi:MAG: permease [Rhizobiaceae bacterium]|nr:permease [Rhizobiaceae bacterium]
MRQSTFATGGLGWFARHEFELSWRDFMRMMSAGKAGREKVVLAFMAVSVIAVHAIAYVALLPVLENGILINKPALAVISGSLVLTFSLMMSQAMEHVTRAFYSRSDLDLILSSPVSAKKLFTVRISAIAVTTAMLSLLLFGSAINILAAFDNIWWLAAYPVLFALSAFATALSVTITIVLFKTVGARKTRLISQIVAAIVGAGFVIGIQLAAITTMGSISRLDFLASETAMANTPDPAHWVWIPARAASGEIMPLLAFVALAFVIFRLALACFAERFGEHVIAAAGISQSATTQRNRRTFFAARSVRATLRRKEWTLLLRDHWLLSQTLMQILYLIPPAYMLWQGFGQTNSLAIVAIPVLVMATGQLSGGLAWLAISGEDAPELVQTAPILKGAVIRAKVEAVLGAIFLLAAPILLLTAIASPYLALVATLGVGAATVSATMIQLWFRSQAKRSNFRRRQTSSKVATIAEAFSSILWAGTAGLAAAGTWMFLFLLPVTLAVLWIARSFRPRAEI